MTAIALPDDSSALPLLTDWLRDDLDLNRPRIASAKLSPVAGEMGTVTDTIEIVLGPGSALPALAASLATWATSRRKRFTISVNGNTVKVHGAGNQDELVRELLDKMQIDEHS